MTLNFDGHSQVTLVSYKKSEGIDFSRYKTFQLYEVTISHIPDYEPREEGLNLFLSGVFKKMEERGLTKAKQDADLLLNFGITITSEVQTRETSRGGCG